MGNATAWRGATRVIVPLIALSFAGLAAAAEQAQPHDKARRVLGAAPVSAAAVPQADKPVPRPSDVRGPLVTVRDAACDQLVKTTAEALVQCMRVGPLWSHMVAFQAIADANPGPDGHPSRNIGEPGYLASAQQVLETLSAAGYSVQLQEDPVPYFNYRSLAHLERTSPSPTAFALRTQWNPPTYSGSGNVTARVQPSTGILIPAPATQTSTSGCSAASFNGFVPGRIALLQRSATCSNYTKVHNAELAGAAGVIIFNDGGGGRTAAFRSSLAPFTPVGIPVALVDYATGLAFYNQYNAGSAPMAHLDVQTIHDPARPDYNVIADSPYGDPNKVVVVEGHLDAIYGSGMLDNASGSATVLEVALQMARTPTANRLRYVWFGGEELGLYGSQYYVDNLTDAEAAQIVFDIDADVTSTPNYVTAIADPANSASAGSWSPAMIQASQRGNNYFREYFEARSLPYVVWSNDGTDSWSFSWRDIPNSGILTGQNCCKTQALVDLFGGQLGNYEGNLGTSDGGFVDRPFLWGDDLANNDPAVLEATSKAFAYVAWKLANDMQLAALVQAKGAPAVAVAASSRVPVTARAARAAAAATVAAREARRAARASQARRTTLGPDR
jgi:Zn-dependent M28 family amino/carboxypeptidase